MTRIRRFLNAVACLAPLIGIAAGGAGCGKPLTGPTPRDETPTPSVTITSVSPSAGISGVQTLVTVHGSGFQFGAGVKFGGVPATITGSTADSITAVTPVLDAGTVDVVVTVTGPGGSSATLAGGYTAEPLVLTARPDRVDAGAPLSVTWSVVSGRPRADWIGLFEVDAPSESYEDVWWHYTDGAASGSFTIDAPARPGVYEFRYLLDDGYIDVARSTVTVVR